VAAPPPGTQAVLNLCESPDDYTAEFYRHEPIRDAPPPPDLDWLRSQVAFIAEQRQAKRTIYVHCLNGVSRSGLVVTAYLMQANGWSRDEAWHLFVPVGQMCGRTRLSCSCCSSGNSFCSRPRVRHVGDVPQRVCRTFLSIQPPS
jgi:hypothetical protein